MFDTVLLPVDINHPESWEKSWPAAKHCAGDGGTVHLLGIVHDLGSVMVAAYLPEGFEQRAMEDLKAKLQDLADAEMTGGPRVEVHVAHGHVPETIQRIAESVNANLIVMASHPHGDLQTLLVGSNADKVVRHSTIPVLTVR